MEPDKEIRRRTLWRQTDFFFMYPTPLIAITTPHPPYEKMQGKSTADVPEKQNIDMQDTN